MFAYSYPDVKPLHKDAIKKFIGKPALLLGKDGYQIKKECDEKFLETIHDHKTPYIISDVLVKNKTMNFGSAVCPDYGVVQDEAVVIVKDKKLACIGKTEKLDGVTYDNTSFLYKPPAQQMQLPANNNESDTTHVLNIGTLKYVEAYCYWSQSANRWCYNASNATCETYTYDNIYINKLGFYDFIKTPPHYELADASATMDYDKQTRDARAYVWHWIQTIKDMIKTETLLAPLDCTELNQYREQIRAGGLVLSAINILVKYKKALDTDNLLYIIGTVKPKYKTKEDLLMYIEDLLEEMFIKGYVL